MNPIQNIIIEFFNGSRGMDQCLATGYLCSTVKPFYIAPKLIGIRLEAAASKAPYDKVEIVLMLVNFILTRSIN